MSGNSPTEGRPPSAQGRRGKPRQGSTGQEGRLPLHPSRGAAPSNTARGGSTQGRGGHQKTNSNSAARTSPVQAHLPQSPSEGEKKLQSLIGDIRAQSASTSTGIQGSESSIYASSGPRSATTGAGAHRRNGSLGASMQPQLPPQSIQIPPPYTMQGLGSGLNPNAGGFQPGGLGSLAEVQNEVLITPTLPTFDANATNQFMNPNLNFTFPPNPQAAQQQQSQAQQTMLQQQLAQLQQLQQVQQSMGMTPQLLEMQNVLLQQIQAGLTSSNGGTTSAQPPRFQTHSPQLSLVGSPPPPQSTSDLVSEQLAIQAQLESLRLQQEALMTRFGDMSRGVIGSPPGVTNAAAAHRRAQSQQVQYGQQPQSATSFAGMAGFQSPPPSASAMPKGHGRRHSVNVVGRDGSPVSATAPPSSATIIGAPSASMSPAQMPVSSNNPQIGFGAFQFPGPGGIENQQVGSDLDFGASPPIGTGGVSGAGGFVAGHSRRESRGSMGGGSLAGWGGTGFGQGPTDLALAQAQLSQLGAFRASSGHSRVPSFGMQQHQNSQQGTPAQQQRKSLFAPYLPQNSIQPLVSIGRLVVGTLRVNKRNRSDAYVSSDVLDADIYVSGSKDRNRALEGDVVAVELLDVDEVWSTKKEKEDKKRKKEENSSYDPRVTQAIRRQDKKNDDVEVEGQGLTLFEDEEVNDESKPKFAGHVVAVVSRTPGQLFSCTLGLLRPSSAATKEKQDAERRERDGVDLRSETNRTGPPPKILWSKPLDKRVPLAAIPVSEAPEGFLDNPEKYANRLFVVAIKRWPITSLHPFGTLVEELGDIGDIEAETSAIMRDCNFSTEDFAEPVVKCVPPVPWTIPEREIEARRDFRFHRVFTIDPETARDLDDALHVRVLEDGTGHIEVGVHIADVSHFVKPNTPIDREARKRATTVYLVQRAYPMLPEVLSSNLCSLLPGEDRLTFSVVFTLTPKGKVIDTWFGKSIIRSRAKLAYGNAQEVIEGRGLPDLQLHDDVKREEIERDIKTLFDLSKHIRAARFENGALRIDNIKLNFALNEDGTPTDCRVFVRKEANELIEEYMLMANIAVAKKIAAAFPDQALLRRHEQPILRRLEGFSRRAKRLGFDIDTSSGGALMRSFTQLQQTAEASALVLQLFATKSMLRAKYFCTGALDIAKYLHYALNVPLYTHFTSPIRRYADVVVHRMLEAALTQPIDPKFPIDVDGMTQIAQQCNTKKEASKQAQEMSQHLFLCSMINNLSIQYGPVIRQAKIIGVLDEAFDVLVPDFGIEKRVHIEQMPIENHVYDEHTNELQIYWKPGVNVVKWLAEYSGDAHLQHMRQNAERHAKLMEASDSKANDESALFDERTPALGGDDIYSTSGQGAKSRANTKPVFEGVEKTKAGHHIQTVRELQTVPVICSADMTKSPPVIKVISLNPFA